MNSTTDWIGLYLDDVLKLYDAEAGQIEFLTMWRREQWRKNEERRITLITEKAFQEHGLIGEDDRWWCGWCSRYLQRKFHDMTRWEWVPSLALLDEEWLWHGDRSTRAFGYLRIVRETAIQFVKENQLENRKGCDI